MLRHQFIIDCCRQKGKSNFINFFLRKGQTNLTKFQVWNRISNKIYRFRPICTFYHKTWISQTGRWIVIRKKTVEIVAQNWHPNIPISMARWSGLAEGGDITVACLPGLCLSSTAIWMSPYGGVVAYRLEWGATSYERARMHVCVPIYAPFQAAPCRNADFVGTETKGVGRESSCLWPMTRSPSLLDCNGVRLEHLSRAHISPCRGRWARNCRSNISHVAQRNN